jgi:hypothetical protein
MLGVYMCEHGSAKGRETGGYIRTCALAPPTRFTEVTPKFFRLCETTGTESRMETSLPVR